MLKEKLSENEKLMKEMSLTWEEKLFKTGKIMNFNGYYTEAYKVFHTSISIVRI